MKTTEHVEYLLRQGRKPKELLGLGFSKHIVTRVKRRLKAEKAVKRGRAPRGSSHVEIQPRSSASPEDSAEATQQKLAFLQGEVKELLSRVEQLEVAQAESVSLEDVEAFLDGTPALNLRDRFQCGCGASGLVALHIQCTKCGRETWWGWLPK